MKNADMPCIPCEVSEQFIFEQGYAGGDSQSPMVRERKFMASGMTKREMIAMHVMASIITQGSPAFIHAAEDAVNAACALLAELERTK